MVNYQDKLVQDRAFWNDALERYGYSAILSMGKTYTDRDFKLKGIEAASRIVKWIPEKCNYILDYGCGAGRIMEFMSRFCKLIVGSDISDKAIEMAGQYLSNIDNKVLLRRDWPQLPYVFDFAYCNAVFVHLPFDQVKLIVDQIMMIVRPGGRFYFGYRSDGGFFDCSRGSYPVSVDEMTKFLGDKYNIVYISKHTAVIELRI